MFSLDFKSTEKQYLLTVFAQYIMRAAHFYKYIHFCDLRLSKSWKISDLCGLHTIPTNRFESSATKISNSEVLHQNFISQIPPGQWSIKDTNRISNIFQPWLSFKSSLTLQLLFFILAVSPQAQYKTRHIDMLIPITNFWDLFLHMDENCCLRNIEINTQTKAVTRPFLKSYAHTQEYPAGVRIENIF